MRSILECSYHRQPKISTTYESLLKNLTSCAVTVVSHCAILKMAVNMKAWNSGNRFMKINLNTR